MTFKESLLLHIILSHIPKSLTGMKLLYVLILSFLAVSGLSLSGCKNNEQVKKVNLNIRQRIVLKEEPDVITYAYLPQYSHTISYTRHHPLVQYLRKKTGLNIKQVFPDTFEQHMKMVGQGKIDISFSNPFIYIKIAHRYGARAFARIVEGKGRNKFRGQIICRSDNSSIQTISDCRNKRWIAVDSTSAGGYLYPLGYFMDHGIKKKDFKNITFAPGPGGKQEKVILSVYAGEYDIGTIREGALDVIAGQIDINKIKIIAMTDPYPGWVYAVRKNLNQKIVSKLKKALLSLNWNDQNDRKILKTANFIRVISSDDSEFDSVRRLATRLGINLDE